MQQPPSTSCYWIARWIITTTVLVSCWSALIVSSHTCKLHNLHFKWGDLKLILELWKFLDTQKAAAVTRSAWQCVKQCIYENVQHTNQCTYLTHYITFCRILFYMTIWYSSCRRTWAPVWDPLLRAPIGSLPKGSNWICSHWLQMGLSRSDT